MSLSSVVHSLYDFLFFSNVPWIERILIYIIIAGLVLGALIFRKSVANDALSMNFSVIGSSVLGNLTFIICNHLINIRYSLGIALIAFFAAGFLVGDKLGDGET